MIFDYLDCRTIVMKLGLVSDQIHEIVKSYNRLKINFSTLSNSYWQSLSQSIQPENIIAISLSNDYSFVDELIDQLNFLLSSFKFNEFIRLKSLKLDGLNGTDMDRLFKHIPKHSLKSLSITLSDRKVNNIHGIIDICSSTILPYGLGHIDLNLSKSALPNIDVLQPIKHVLQSLAINDCTYEEYHRILSSSVNLRTFLIQNYTGEKNFSTTLSTLVESNYPRLKSLTINSRSLIFEQVCSMLSLTPSLVHLQINLQDLKNDCILNGTDWEEFLQNKLIHLNNFQFYFACDAEMIDRRRSLSSIIEPFKTTFWLKEKRWIVLCDFILRTSEMILYTLSSPVNHRENAVRCRALSLNDQYHIIKGRRANHSNDLSSEKVIKIDNDMRHIFNEIAFCTIFRVVLY